MTDIFECVCIYDATTDMYMSHEESLDDRFYWSKSIVVLFPPTFEEDIHTPNCRSAAVTMYGLARRVPYVFLVSGTVLTAQTFNKNGVYTSNVDRMHFDHVNSIRLDSSFWKNVLDEH